jgi:hypothetical protein
MTVNLIYHYFHFLLVAPFLYFVVPSKHHPQINKQDSEYLLTFVGVSSSITSPLSWISFSSTTKQNHLSNRNNLFDITLIRLSWNVSNIFTSRFLFLRMTITKNDWNYEKKTLHLLFTIQICFTKYTCFTCGNCTNIISSTIWSIRGTNQKITSTSSFRCNNCSFSAGSHLKQKESYLLSYYCQTKVLPKNKSRILDRNFFPGAISSSLKHEILRKNVSPIRHLTNTKRSFLSPHIRFNISLWK